VLVLLTDASLFSDGDDDGGYFHKQKAKMYTQMSFMYLKINELNPCLLCLNKALEHQECVYLNNEDHDDIVRTKKSIWKVQQLLEQQKGHYEA
jgi:hypothetical protein